MLRIIGVHPTDARQPCWLIEAEIADPDAFDWGKVTQSIPGRARENWQAVWDERPLDDSRRRWAFFFHYLDFEKPFLTPDGPVPVPGETPTPERLRHIAYEEP